MATYERRTSRTGEVTWRVRVRVKGHPTQTATFDRKTDATEWAKRTESQALEAIHFPHREAQRRNVSEAIDRYLADVLPMKARNADRKQRETALAWWKGKLGGYRLSAMEAGIITKARNELSNGRTGATANRYLAALSHACSQAVRWGWLRSNPCAGLRLSESRGRTRYLSDAERADLLRECRASDQPALAIIVTLALSTGMRRGEIMSLRWDAMDLKNKTIRLEKTKNGDRRLVPLVGKAAALVADWSKVRRIDSKLVFPGKNAEKPLDFEDAWQCALKRAGIKEFRFHDLRHSAASYLAMTGATPSELAAVLGHRTLSMVKRYAHIADSHTSAVVERMNRKMLGE